MDIQSIIEANWDNDDEYLPQEHKDYLVEHSLMAEWQLAYFLDLVDHYQGSCYSISGKHSDFLEDFDLFSDLDDIQFECGCCGWWYETGEQGHCPDGEDWCEDCCNEQGYGEEE